MLSSQSAVVYFVLSKNSYICCWRTAAYGDPACHAHSYLVIFNSPNVGIPEIITQR